MEYRVVYRLTRSQTDELHRLYRREWWSAERTREEVERMLEHTDLVVGIIDPEERLAGFARVLTDRVFKAEIYDVIVEESHRGRGLGRQLLKEIFAHPMLREVRQFNLQCLEERKAFYKEMGFEDLRSRLVYMRKENSIRRSISMVI